MAKLLLADGDEFSRAAMGGLCCDYANPDRTSKAIGSGSRPMNFR
jgi:hypothetical protein